MSLSLLYNLRHLKARPLTNALTVGGIALVLFVYTATLMLARGLEQTLSATGSPSNVIVLRSGAQNEIQSSIDRENAQLILTAPHLTMKENNVPRHTTDLLVLLSLPRRSDNARANVNIRGVTPDAYTIRPDVKLIEGKLPTPGTQEIIVGNAVFKRFGGTAIGDSLRLAGTNWSIVGRFDAGNTAFSSEVWGDVEVMLPIFRRVGFSSVTLQMTSPDEYEKVKQFLEAEPRLNVSVKREQDFYRDQSKIMASFIEYLGTFVTIVFSIAAIIGSMITLYSAVAHRTREIGILRALGFSRITIVSAFVQESLLLAFCGGVLGVALASFTSFLTFSTINFSTFSDLTFGFTITPGIMVKAILFSLIMGVIGVLLPALRAARLKVLDSLRSQ